MVAPDDRRRHTGLGEQPGQGHLRRWHVAGGGDLHDGIDDIEVRRLVVEVVGEGVGARAGRVTPTVTRPVPRQHPARQGAPRNAPHPLVEAERNHLALLLAVDQVVVVLHGDEPGPAVRLGGVLRLGELPGEHAAGPDVARLAGAHDVVQRLHRLLDGRPGIPAVDLIEVHVLHLEVLERRVDARQDVLATEAAAVFTRADRHEHLGGDDGFVPRQVLGHQLPGRHLAGAAGIGIRGVEEGDAALDGRPHDRLRCILVNDPRPVTAVPEAHHAQADPRDA